MRLTVAKVGGSLFDLPDLSERLRRWRATVAGPVLLVPGGGAGADVIRRMDRVHRLGDEIAHWLALRVLAVNAHLLSELVGAPVVSHPPPCPTSPERERRMDLPPSLTLRAGELGVLDALPFCLADDVRPGALEHHWGVTSDSISARVAEATGAELVLLKSAELPAGLSWQIAAQNRLVDSTFPNVVERAKLQVTWVNLLQFRSQ